MTANEMVNFVVDTAIDDHCTLGGPRVPRDPAALGSPAVVVINFGVRQAGLGIRHAVNRSQKRALLFHFASLRLRVSALNSRVHLRRRTGSIMGWVLLDGNHLYVSEADQPDGEREEPTVNIGSPLAAAADLLRQILPRNPSLEDEQDPGQGDPIRRTRPTTLRLRLRLRQ